MRLGGVCCLGILAVVQRMVAAVYSLAALMLTGESSWDRAAHELRTMLGGTYPHYLVRLWIHESCRRKAFRQRLGASSRMGRAGTCRKREPGKGRMSS